MRREEKEGESSERVSHPRASLGVSPCKACSWKGFMTKPSPPGEPAGCTWATHLLVISVPSARGYNPLAQLVRVQHKV